MRRQAWLVPLVAGGAAILVIAALAIFAFAEREPGATPLPADSADTTATPTPAGATPSTTTASGRPQLQPEQSVCQGILHVPESGQPRVFASVYTQRVDYHGFAIVATGKVSKQAFQVAETTLDTVFHNPELAAPLIEQQAYVIIADPSQGLLDLPEFKCLGGQPGSGVVATACGIQDRADYPVVAVSELDLIGDRRGPCQGLNVLYHELGHLVQGWSISPPDYFDVRVFYTDALAAGKYRGLYAATNPLEYFAEGTQAYFLHVDPNGQKDRAWLESYDPPLYELLARVYGD